jgi:hypothetical protein
MPIAHIKLACQHIIDAYYSTPFEQQIFHATYQEFRLQQQSFSKGQDLFTWSDIKEKYPKSDPILPSKVSFAIAGLMQTLHKKIPGLMDTLNLKPIHFANHYFHLLASDSRDPLAHKVSIIYLTDTLDYFGNFGDRLLLAETGTGSRHERSEGVQTNAESGDAIQTFMLKMDGRLSIVSYGELWQQPAKTCFAPHSAPLSSSFLFP